MNESQLIQIRMRLETLNQIDQIRENVHAPSRSDAIRRAIELTAALSEEIKHGSKVYY